MIATIIISIIVFTLACLALKKVIKDRRSGKCSCGGDCSKCSGCK